MNVKLKETDKIKLLNSSDIYGVMQKILMRENKISRNKEHFWVLGLANNNRILYIELVSLGTINKTLVEPMEVYSLALQKRSVKIILVHNHPSGELLPSEEDKDVTDHMIQVGNFLNIPVLDHLIISETSYNSFSDTGLLGILAKSKKYVVPYIEERRIKKEIADEAKVKGKKERTNELVRIMKREKIPLEIIKRVTGLTEKEINRLNDPVPRTKKPKK